MGIIVVLILCCRAFDAAHRITARYGHSATVQSRPIDLVVNLGCYHTEYIHFAHSPASQLIQWPKLELLLSELKIGHTPVKARKVIFRGHTRGLAASQYLVDNDR